MCRQMQKMPRKERRMLKDWAKIRSKTRPKSSKSSKQGRPKLNAETQQKIKYNIKEAVVKLERIDCDSMEWSPAEIVIKEESQVMEEAYVKLEPIPDEFDSQWVQHSAVSSVEDHFSLGMVNGDENDQNESIAESEFESDFQITKNEIDVDEETVNALREEMMQMLPDDDQQFVEQPISDEKNSRTENNNKSKRAKERKKASVPQGPFQVTINSEKKLKCPLCEFTTSLQDKCKIEHHWRKHTGEKPFKCLFCSLSFISISLRNYHIRRQHPSAIKYRSQWCGQTVYIANDSNQNDLQGKECQIFECYLCGIECRKRLELRVHMKRAHIRSQQEHKCGICSDIFTTRAGLSCHIVRKHSLNEDAHKCSNCPKCFKSKQSLSLHRRKCLEKSRGPASFQCQFCAMEFKSKKNLHRHIQKHGDFLKFSCNSCSRKFLFNSELEQHRAYCRGQKRRYQCYLCTKPKPGINRSEVRRHMLVHHVGGKLFPCQRCNQSFSKPRYLTHHVYQNHPQLLKLTCLVCDRRFGSKAEKMQHQNKCTLRRVECYICRMRLDDMRALQGHMVTQHTGDKKFQCKICKRTFSHENRLKIHVLGSHNKRNSLKCSHCPRTFPHITHKNIHESHCKRSFECYLCKKIFPNLRTLHKGHMRVHLGPYKCKYCNITSVNLRYCQFHMMDAHLPSFKLQCNFCQKFIEKRQDVKTHEKLCMRTMKQSSSFIFFKCNLCGEALKRVPNLRRHIVLAECKKAKLVCKKKPKHGK